MRGLLLAAILWSGIISVSHAEPLGRSYDVAGWNVSAFTNDQTGIFSHCAASVSYQSGILMLFAVNNAFGWSLGFANDQWDLVPGENFDIVYTIDRTPPIRATAQVVNKSLVQIPMPDSTQLFDRFRRGFQLTVVARGGRFQFNLTNSAQALTAVLDCTRRNIAASAPRQATNPFSDRPIAAAQNNPTIQPDLKAEASVMAANILSSSGVRGFRLLPPDEVSKELSVFDAVWSSEDGVMGSVKILSPDVARSVEEISTKLTASDAEACKGSFASAKQRASEEGSVRLMTGCEGVDQANQVTYSIVKRPKGGFYVMAVYSLAEARSSAKEIDSRVYAATVNFVTKR